MPNTLDANGLIVATTDEIAADLAVALKAVYGEDINLDSESPDGQMVGIYAQADSDALDLLVDIYNMFDVDSAYGIGLQRLVSINGMTIKPGSFTTTPVNITTDRAITLPGLDQSTVAPYQVQDANTVWTLISSFVFGSADTQALVFQASEMGPITPLPNTITIQATPLVGVTAVNNPTTTGSVIGALEETDEALRVRHAKSFQLAAIGPADAVEGQLGELDGITDALVISNNTPAEVDGVPANSIWPIVVGTAAPADIAQVIYTKVNPGCGLFGAQTYDIIRPNGQPVTMKWDIGLPQQLFARFGIIPSVPGLTFDNDLLRQQLAAQLLNYFKLGQAASIGDLVRKMFVIEPRAILVSAGVSTAPPTYNDTVDPTSEKYYFTLSADDITIT